MSENDRTADFSPAYILDTPIKEQGADYFKFYPIAKNFAENIRQLTPGGCYTIAVTGGWGSGKSSFLHLVKKELEDQTDDQGKKDQQKILLFAFSPWMFSGRDDVVSKLFQSIHSEFKNKYKNKIPDWSTGSKAYSIIEEVLDYLEFATEISSPIIGRLPLALVGTARFASRMVYSHGQAARRNFSTLEGKRESIIEGISKLNEKFKLVIFIDDIDRLTGSEIRNLFQAVKAVSDFPNVIYVLSYDQKIVEEALDYEFHKADSFTHNSGQEYLKKIVQFSMPVPDTAPFMKRQIETCILSMNDKTNEEYRKEHLSLERRWDCLFRYGLSRFIKNQRDVIRLHNTLLLIQSSITDEIDFLDLLCLQIIREYNPQLYEEIRLNSRFYYEGDVECINDVNPILNSQYILNRGYYTLQERQSYFRGVLEKFKPESEMQTLLVYLFPGFKYALGYVESPSGGVGDMSFPANSNKSVPTVPCPIPVYDVLVQNKDLLGHLYYTSEIRINANYNSFRRYFSCFMEVSSINQEIEKLLQNFWSPDEFLEKMKYYHSLPENQDILFINQLYVIIHNGDRKIPPKSLDNIVLGILSLGNDFCTENTMFTTGTLPYLYMLLKDLMYMEEKGNASLLRIVNGFKKSENIILMSYFMRQLNNDISKHEKCEKYREYLEPLAEVYQQRFLELLPENEPMKLLLPCFFSVYAGALLFESTEERLSSLIRKIWNDQNLHVKFIHESMKLIEADKLNNFGVLLLYYVVKDEAINEINGLIESGAYTEDEQKSLEKYRELIDEWDFSSSEKQKRWMNCKNSTSP